MSAVNSAIPTYGEILPNLHIESVLDPHRSGTLSLQCFDGRRVFSQPSIEHKGRAYIPGPIAGGLVQAVRFPPRSAAFGSPAKLFSEMNEFLSDYASPGAEVVDVLIAFGLASWFVDCFQVAPVLYLIGPENEVNVVLRLLGCLCFHPVLLGDLDLAALTTLPSQLHATLLINQPDLDRRVRRILLASNSRYFCLARGKRPMNVYGAKALASDSWSNDHPGLRVSLSPSQRPLPPLTDIQEQAIAARFQSKLLRYRMVYHPQVREKEIDAGGFFPGMRDEVRTWLAPICNCSDLQKRVAHWLSERSEDLAGARLCDPKCVVAEAALMFCHRRNTEYFYVRELQEKANDLLLSRHENLRLEDRKVGSLLRDLGLRGKRVTHGYRIELIDSVREQIHRIATSYQVASVQDGTTRCPYCVSGKANGKSNRA
jgi:thiol-disulfide isomerase/thioredoxin